ncbi:MAG: nitroreductase family protein [Candidatus Methanofastidiosia archaeon]
MKLVEEEKEKIELFDEKAIQAFFDAIRTRRSIREFTGERIPDEDLEKILDAARYAPSPENMQMWRYVVIRDDQELKDLIADIAVDAASEVFGSVPYELTQARLWYLSDKYRPATFETMRDGSLFDYPKYADVVIIGCGSETFHDSPLVYPQEYFGSIVVGMGILQMWIAAHVMGYGAGYQAFPIMEPRRCELICDRIGIPRTWTPLATLSIGVPKAKRMLGPSRFSIESVFYSERWGKVLRRLAFKEE